MRIELTPYQPSYDGAIASLEDSSVQGKGIQLKIIKNHFLDRSAVFQHSFPCIALTDDDKVIATAVGAQTKMVINKESIKAGFVFDAKVHLSYRRNGVGMRLARHQKDWFSKQGFEKNFTTLKLSNAPVIKVSAKAIGNIWLTPFVYLTIPTRARVSSTLHAATASDFSVRLFDEELMPAGFHTNFGSGLGVLHTWKLYRLKIERISWLYKQGLKCLKKIYPKQYHLLPKEKEVMEFGTLFNHSEQNIDKINEVLQHLDKNEKRFLIVCCRKGDSIYNYLKPYSINTYHYYMLTDFALSIKDHLEIDVRCL